MTDLNNSGMSDLEDVNEVLKDDTTTTVQKETELGKIKQKFGRGGFIKIDKFIEVKTKIVNFVIASQSINEVKDVDVTQGTATGTLMVALTGDVTRVKVKQNDDSPTEFNDTVDLVIGSTTVVGSNITSAEYLKVYYGICRKKLKQSRYKNFKKKNENTSAEFDNAFIDRVLDYDDLTPEDDSEGPLDSKEKLQKMVDLTNSKTTTSADEKKFAGKDKDVHITVDGKGSESSTSTKSYKIGNFSGWNKSGNTVSYDSNKVGAGNRPSSMTDTDWTKSKKEKTMYWKKDTTGQQGGSGPGVYRKKKKTIGEVTTDWGGSGRHKKKTVENIDKTELDDVKDNVDADSPIIEVGETNDATDGDAYVLFKLKRKPKNATKVE
jgi:hypothetical protein